MCNFCLKSDLFEMFLIWYGIWFHMAENFDAEDGVYDFMFWEYRGIVLQIESGMSEFRWI